MRYCLYCMKQKPEEGFKEVLHAATRSVRGQCLDCQEKRKKPRTELEKLAKAESKERKKR